MSGRREPLRALATVTLDASVLEHLDIASLDRLADLVAARLDERGQAPLLTAAEAAAIAGVHPETVRRAIRVGALEVAGYIGTRPRLRREAVETWVAAGRVQQGRVHTSTLGSRRARPVRRVLGEALRTLHVENGRAA